MQRRQFLTGIAAVPVAGMATRGDAEPDDEPAAALPEFRAGAAARSIVPDPAIANNKLHGVMTVRFDERGSELQVKALALSWQGTRRLLLAIDSIVISDAHADALRAAVAKATGVAQEEIVVTASHSHSTPFLEPLDGPAPYFDLVRDRTVAAAQEAVSALQPARIGVAGTHVVGGSFNTRVPTPRGVKFTRDFREGLATGRPIDPRLTVLRIDDAAGRPIAGWVRFAAHPACVILEAPISAEYPGYLTDALSRGLPGKPPVLFGYGASGDINCLPMFGSEADARRLGEQLAAAALPAFEGIRTSVPRRFAAAARIVELPLDPIPSPAVLDAQIADVERFVRALDEDPSLDWVLDINCKSDWPVETKRRHVKPLADWARMARDRLADGGRIPQVWPRRITTWLIDDLVIVFESGETLVELGLDLAARSPARETLLVSMANGSDPYLGNDTDRRLGGYETHTSTRYALWRAGARPLPYASGAGGRYVGAILQMIESLRDPR